MTANGQVTLTAVPRVQAAPSATNGRSAHAATKALRVALVSEGSYPFHPGGVSLWCHQLIQGMPEHSFTVVALTVDGTERSKWSAPDNLTEVVNIPLWGPPSRRRRWRRTPPASFAQHYEALLRTILQPLTEEHEAARTDEFVAALRGLYEYAQEGDLTSAMICNDSLDRLRRAWHDAGLDDDRPGAVGPLTLRDTLTAADRIEHLLRSLSHPPVQADVCHLAMNGTSALVGLASKWAYDTPLVVSEHGVYLRERYLSLAAEDQPKAVQVIAMRFTRRLTAGAYRSADVLAPHSSYNSRWQLYGGADPARMRTMYNGINPSDFPTAQGEPEDPTIVFVGRIDPLKDLHTLIQAFAIVRERFPNARLRMFGPVPAGNEPYHTSCVKLVADLGLSDAATFEGHISRQADAYEAGHLVALTSVSEGFPFTVVESMSMGRPQVCTNVGGVSEAVGEAGFLVPTRDPKAVADACVRLLEDPDLRRSFGLLARQRVLDLFTLDQWTNAYREVYAELVPALPSDASRAPAADAQPAARRAFRFDDDTLLPTAYSRAASSIAGGAHRHDSGAPVLHWEDRDESQRPDEPLIILTGRTGQAESEHGRGRGHDDEILVLQAARGKDTAEMAVDGTPVPMSVNRSHRAGAPMEAVGGAHSNGKPADEKPLNGQDDEPTPEPITGHAQESEVAP
jgi:polysaccharide biosynthesis protein PelF